MFMRNGSFWVAAIRARHLAMGRPSKVVSHQRHFLREWREHRGYKQDQAAEMIGVSQSFLSRVENGKVKYVQPFLERVAEVYGCGPGDLVMRNPLDKSSLWSIHDQLAKAPAEKREQAAAIVEALLKTGTDG